MKPAGYSGTPLAKKLGIKFGSRCQLLGAPEGLVEMLASMEPAASFDGPPPFDVVLLFSPSRASLMRLLQPAIEGLEKNGGLWVCWPKKSSGIATDLGEEDLRTIILPLGLVDNKVCAVTDVRSGLKFVWRKELR